MYVLHVNGNGADRKQAKDKTNWTQTADYKLKINRPKAYAVTLGYIPVQRAYLLAKGRKEKYTRAGRVYTPCNFLNTL